MDGELLFVNKTASSAYLSRSKRAEKSKILSHVQNKRRKQEAQTATQQDSEQPWSSYTLVMGAGRARPKNESDKKKGKAKEDTAIVQLPATYPSHNSSDPFYSTVAGLDNGSHVLLKCTFYKASRSNFLAEAFAPSDVCLHRYTMRHDAVFEQRLRQCVQDPTLMFATLAYGSTFLGWSVGSTKEMSRPAEYYLGKALQGVRRRLASHKPTQATIDRWLVLSIYALAVTEFWNGIPEMWYRFPEKRTVVLKTGRFGLAACRVHLNALVQLVTKSGGWENFDPYILDSVILVDKYISMYELQPPMIPLTWDPGPLFEERVVEADGNLFPLMGIGFLQLSISETLQSILQDIVSYCRGAHIAWAQPAVTPDTEMWLFRRLQALLYRLIILYHQDGDNISRVERCVCLTAQIFLLSCTAHGGPLLAAQALVPHLRTHLNADISSTLGLDDLDLNHGLRLWCVCTCAILPGMFPSREWFGTKLKEFCCPETTAEVFQAAMEPWLFIPQKQGDQLKLVVQKVAWSSGIVEDLTVGEMVPPCY